MLCCNPLQLCFSYVSRRTFLPWEPSLASCMYAAHDLHVHHAAVTHVDSTPKSSSNPLSVQQSPAAAARNVQRHALTCGPTPMIRLNNRSLLDDNRLSIAVASGELRRSSTQETIFGPLVRRDARSYSAWPSAAGTPHLMLIS